MNGYLNPSHWWNNDRVTSHHVTHHLGPCSTPQNMDSNLYLLKNNWAIIPQRYDSRLLSICLIRYLSSCFMIHVISLDPWIKFNLIMKHHRDPSKERLKAPVWRLRCTTPAQSQLIKAPPAHDKDITHMDRHGILILNKWNIYIYLIWGSCNLSHAFLGWANMFGNLTSVEMEKCPDGPNVADVAMVQLTQKWFRGHQNGDGLEPWRGFAGRTSNFYQALTSRLDQLIVLYSLVGGWPTPLKNISQLGILFPIYGKNKECSRPPTSI